MRTGALSAIVALVATCIVAEPASAQTVAPAAQTATPTTAPAIPAVAAPGTSNASAAAATNTATNTAAAQNALPPLPTPVAPSAPARQQAPSGASAATAATRATTSTSKTAASAPITTSPGADAMLTKLAPQMDLRMGGGKNDGGLHLSGTVGIVVMMGLLTLLPTMLLLMTGFTRILIVLHFLRQALGTQNAPPSQLIAALALILTGFVMAPTLNKVNETALQPWMDGKIEQAEMMKTAVVPFREFMLKHTRDHDLQVFIDMSAGPQPQNENDIPLVTLVSAFATSELRTSFQIGFALFLPFIIIDIVVASVLMSMGMFMLPPAMISLPFKLLLFVLVDGWTLVIQSLVTSFRP
ncbi:MAG TPA: flagellar type III secretion system pore protein FliP [Candidatus Elarobacter sp.]|nr:flagellar type III secretion system pore protein FliP [Candidatus Elarobacter sp.]